MLLKECCDTHKGKKMKLKKCFLPVAVFFAFVPLAFGGVWDIFGKESRSESLMCLV